MRGKSHPCCRAGVAVTGGTTLREGVPGADLHAGRYTHFFRADHQYEGKSLANACYVSSHLVLAR